MAGRRTKGWAHFWETGPGLGAQCGWRRAGEEGHWVGDKGLSHKVGLGLGPLGPRGLAERERPAPWRLPTRS